MIHENTGSTPIAPEDTSTIEQESLVPYPVVNSVDNQPSLTVTQHIHDKLVKIAKVCHEMNKAICESTGDMSQKSWEDAEDWQRASAITGVAFALDNPDAPASAQHDAWSRDKVANGWKYGPVKDAEKKEHPCLVSFEDLPFEQRIKDVIFKQVVKSLTHYE